MYGIFPTADGWIAIVGVVGPARTTFFEMIGRPDLSDQFSQIFYWNEDKAALFPILDELFRTRTTDEWCALLDGAGLRHAPVRDHAAVVADPAAWANGFFAKVDGPTGEETVVAAPVRFSDTAARSPAGAPELGQHTEEVLLELGYSWEDIAALSAEGAI
jgi:crotonobetainyl-CoA:carnitine CoA-transferase CaiB-like acyl-CoA transferase